MKAHLLYALLSPDTPCFPPAAAVGKRVLIKFTDGKFYSGIVLDYNATTKKSTG